jgi:kinesin family protein C2/C3
LKKQREKKIMELEDDIKEAEKQRQSLRDQIQNIELKLSENKKLFSTTYSLQESDDLVTSASLKDDFKEVIETPKTSKKNIQRSVSNSVPRFMSSTVASRHRQIASEQEIGGRTKSLRSVVTRSSIQFPCSQSLSYSDLRIKTILRSSTGKSRYAETNNVPNTESPKCNESESKVITPRSTTVASSDSNLRSTLYHHRRRMSNLI